MPNLITRLDPVAQWAAERRSRLRRLAEAEDVNFSELARCAAFLAFVELGGNAECPEAFPWTARQEELRTETVRQLTYAIQGATTGYGDARMRRNPRMLPLSDRWWDAWETIPLGAMRNPEHLYTALARLPQLRRLTEETYGALYPALVEILTPFEVWVLTQTYLYRRRKSVLAEEIMAGQGGHPPVPGRGKTTSEYVGPLGRKRLQKVLDQTSRRALKRCRQRLGPDWMWVWEDARQ